jgi:DNA-binding NarL/FixJ family response regulator
MAAPPGTQAEVDFSTTTFLIADDKPFFRDMVHTAITRAGARDIKHATSIDKALELLQRYARAIGCIICDWDMPPKGGLELLRLIRTGSLSHTSPKTCLIILTPRADSGAVKTALALDVNGVAVAPLSLEKLNKTIAQGMSRTLTLKTPEQYAAIARVALPGTMPEASEGGAAVGVVLNKPPAAAAAPTAPKPKAKSKAPELVNVRMRTLADVQPGAVLAKDLRDPQGQLLLRTGPELSSGLLNRLREVAKGHSDSYHIWIGDRDRQTA